MTAGSQMLLHSSPAYGLPRRLLLVVGEESGLYLEADLTSYSVYYLTEKASGSSDMAPICMIAATLVIVAVITVFLLKRKRDASKA